MFVFIYNVISLILIGYFSNIMVYYFWLLGGGDWLQQMVFYVF